MRKVTPEQIAQKREEIINACEKLYQTMSFREITLKEIGSITSFSRPTIYNYFETKERSIASRASKSKSPSSSRGVSSRSTK